MFKDIGLTAIDVLRLKDVGLISSAEASWFNFDWRAEGSAYVASIQAGGVNVDIVVRSADLSDSHRSVRDISRATRPGVELLTVAGQQLMSIVERPAPIGRGPLVRWVVALLARGLKLSERQIEVFAADQGGTYRPLPAE